MGDTSAEIAAASVNLLLQNLKELLLYHPYLISRDAKSQVEMLEKNLRLFKAFLSDSIKKESEDESLRELVRQIRDVVYEAEDIIDAFVSQAAESKSVKYLGRSFDTLKNLPSIVKNVERVGAKVKDIYAKSRIDFASLSVADDESKAPAVRQDNVVGFEDEAEILIGYLTEETQQLDVITIVGKPGLGKTTLAGKIFRDPGIQCEFPTRIWVYVSQEFTKHDVFLAILRGLDSLTEDILGESEQELAKLVASRLERKKFLIVMDDVWTAEDWDELQLALPKSNKMGKVLITSRYMEVARYANRIRPPHNLRFLTQKESWLLLQLEVFGKPECPPELEVLGELIAEQCDGLPLAIVVIGSILAKQNFSSSDMSAWKTAWRKVYENEHIYLIERIFNELPNHLRPCLLYFGMFPEEFEIPVWKLIRMWIAEGFIQLSDSLTLEETAEKYLEDLINRNLVRIDKIKSDGKVKTCRIHDDKLLDFCKTAAGNESECFLQEIKSSDGVFEPPVSDVGNYRRLCIHSNVSDFLSSKPHGPHVRSFVCFSREEITLPPENSSAIPLAFKLLRVLDVKPIRFTKIPSDLYQLIHLRYIVLSFINLSILPSAFAKLWKIQTLIVDTTSRTLEIKADIWKMNQLRHLKTNASATLPKPSKSSTEVEKLQTLGTISVQSCTEEVFDRACNLKKLGIRGQLSLLLKGKSGSFDSLVQLSNLKKLKLVNDDPNPPSQGKLRGLPQPYQFPPKLRRLTLSATYLDWSHMSILGSLENLKVLKLKDNAFMGKRWVATDGDFRKLEVLHIGRTDLAIWEASGHHFPRLTRLELRNCEELREVPIRLADIPTLQQLDLQYCTKIAAASAKKIHEVKQKKQKVFKLSIFPHE